MNLTTTNKSLNPAWKMRMTLEEKKDFERVDLILRVCDQRDEVLDFAAVREAAETLRRNYLKRVGQRLTQEQAR